MLMFPVCEGKILWCCFSFAGGRPLGGFLLSFGGNADYLVMMDICVKRNYSYIRASFGFLA